MDVASLLVPQESDIVSAKYVTLDHLYDVRRTCDFAAIQVQHSLHERYFVDGFGPLHVSRVSIQLIACNGLTSLPCDWLCGRGRNFPPVSYSSSLPPLRDTNIPLAVLVRIVLKCIRCTRHLSETLPSRRPGADLHSLNRIIMHPSEAQRS